MAVRATAAQQPEQDRVRRDAGTKREAPPGHGQIADIRGFRHDRRMGNGAEYCQVMDSIYGQFGAAMAMVKTPFLTASLYHRHLNARDRH